MYWALWGPMGPKCPQGPLRPYGPMGSKCPLSAFWGYGAQVPFKGLLGIGAPIIKKTAKYIKQHKYIYRKLLKKHIHILEKSKKL